MLLSNNLYLFLTALTPLVTAVPRLESRAPDFNRIGLTAYTEPNRRGYHMTWISMDNYCWQIPDNEYQRTAMNYAASFQLRMLKCNDGGGPPCDIVDPPLEGNAENPVIQCMLYNTYDCKYTFSGIDEDRCLLEHYGPSKVPGWPDKDDGADLSSCLRRRKLKPGDPDCDTSESLCETKQFKSFKCKVVKQRFTAKPPA